jgi:hypothetical protein
MLYFSRVGVERVTGIWGIRMVKSRSRQADSHFAFIKSWWRISQVSGSRNTNIRCGNCEEIKTIEDEGTNPGFQPRTVPEVNRNRLKLLVSRPGLNLPSEILGRRKYLSKLIPIYKR